LRARSEISCTALAFLLFFGGARIFLDAIGGRQGCLFGGFEVLGLLWNST
jgi:hypothetical protein